MLLSLLSSLHHTYLPTYLPNTEKVESLDTLLIPVIYSQQLDWKAKQTLFSSKSIYYT